MIRIFFLNEKFNEIKNRFANKNYKSINENFFIVNFNIRIFFATIEFLYYLNKISIFSDFRCFFFQI